MPVHVEAATRPYRPSMQYLLVGVRAAGELLIENTFVLLETAKTLKRMLAEETPMMLEVEAGEGQTTKVFASMVPLITTSKR